MRAAPLGGTIGWVAAVELLALDGGCCLLPEKLRPVLAR
jgi:hypothetical protein